MTDAFRSDFRLDSNGILRGSILYLGYEINVKATRTKLSFYTNGYIQSEYVSTVVNNNNPSLIIDYMLDTLIIQNNANPNA